MSKLRRYRKSLIGSRMKIAFAMEHLLAVSPGGMAEVKQEFKTAVTESLKQEAHERTI